MNLLEAEKYAFIFMCLCIAFSAVAIAWSVAKAGVAICDFYESDDDESSGGGDQPVGPYNIDPDFDPSDWWKHERKEKAR